MTCKGCGKKASLVKAHIIPESFFRSLRDTENTLKVLTNVEGQYTKRAPIGVYDKNILCEVCEKKFQDADNYASTILIDNGQIEDLMHLGEVVGYKIRNIDYSLLKQFVLSILWRASISDSYYYKKVNLGPLENKIKELVWNKDVGSVDEFSFVLAKFQDTGTVSKTMLDPHQERWWGIRYYRFYLSGYVLYVKADSQKTPEEWARFIPTNNELILISRGRIENSKEYPLLVKIAQKSG